MSTTFAIQESKNIKSATNRIKKIWDAKYEKANFKKITTKLKYLNSDEHLLTYRLSKKHENMFDGTLGSYTAFSLPHHPSPLLSCPTKRNQEHE